MRKICHQLRLSPTVSSMRIFLILFTTVICMPSVAVARSSITVEYNYHRVWTTSIRLFRIDLGCPIKEKDRENGYFIFEYKDGGRTFSGSVELIKIRSNKGVGEVRVIVQIAQLPQYIERMMLNRLTRKLSADFGEPLAKGNDSDDNPSNEKKADGQKSEETSAESGQKESNK